MTEHPIEGLMETAMNSIKDMIDVNTIIGDPIETATGTVIIPISKVCFGFASGGSEFKGETIDEYKKKDKEEEVQYRLPFGGGSGMLGLPGDFTPPSRFVRAAFMQMSVLTQPSAFDAVIQCFRILNNFDIPIGMAHSDTIPDNLPGATQITIVTDQKNRKLYFRTVWNSNIRCINTADINYQKVKYQVHILDDDKNQPIEYLIIR